MLYKYANFGRPFTICRLHAVIYENIAATATGTMNPYVQSRLTASDFPARLRPMIFTVFKIFFSAGVIALSSWLSGKKPELAGFIIALPLMTLLVLPFSHAEYHDTEASVQFARSIFTAIPLSLLFFLPFLFATRLQWGFWPLYLTGAALLVAGYFAHRTIMHWF